MIIFTETPVLANTIGSRFNQPYVILNLSSLYSGYEELTDIITSLHFMNTMNIPMVEFVDSVEFDIQMANSIISDNHLFSMLMKIMMYSLESYNVIILVQRDSYRDAVMESLIKLIQQRYGYNAWVVEDLDDIDCLKESYYSPEGIMTLDNDVKRYIDLVNNGIIKPVMPMVSIE